MDPTHPAHPVHHLHISTPAVLLIGIIAVSIFGLIVYWMTRKEEPEVKYLYRDRPREPASDDHGYEAARPRQSPWTPPPSGNASAPPPYAPRAYAPAPAPAYAPAPPQAPVYVNTGNNSNGLVEGLILGEMLAGNHGGRTEVIHEREYVERDEPTYERDSGITYDDDDRSVASQDDSSGIDISWGGDDSSSSDSSSD